MKIESKHIDGYGHVNNAVYLQLFEEARWDWIQKGGGNRELVAELGVGPIVVDIEIRFSRELKENEEITIRSGNEGAMGKVYWLRQTIFKANGDIACKAKYRMAFLDIKKRVITEPHPRWVEVLTKSLKGNG
ncbi:MAG: acyl-CoA thioesterase [Bdellovibrionota bacterium]